MLSDEIAEDENVDKSLNDDYYNKLIVDSEA